MRLEHYLKNTSVEFNDWEPTYSVHEHQVEKFLFTDFLLEKEFTQLSNFDKIETLNALINYSNIAKGLSEIDYLEKQKAYGEESLEYTDKWKGILDRRGKVFSGDLNSNIYEDNDYIIGARIWDGYVIIKEYLNDLIIKNPQFGKNVNSYQPNILQLASILNNVALGQNLKISANFPINNDISDNTFSKSETNTIKGLVNNSSVTNSSVTIKESSHNSKKKSKVTLKHFDELFLVKDWKEYVDVLHKTIPKLIDEDRNFIGPKFGDMGVVGQWFNFLKGEGIIKDIAYNRIANVLNHEIKGLNMKSSGKIIARDSKRYTKFFHDQLHKLINSLPK